MTETEKVAENSSKDPENTAAKSKNDPEKGATTSKRVHEKKDTLKENIMYGSGGILVVLLLSVVVQYFYHNYYVLPLEERTLFNVINQSENPKQWTVNRQWAVNESTLMWKFDNLNLIKIELEKANVKFSIMKGNKNFGHLKAADLLEVKYVVFQTSWKAELSVSTHAPAAQLLLQLPSEINKEETKYIGQHSVLGNYSIDISHHEVDSVDSNTLRITLNPGKSCLIQFNVEENVVSGSFSDHFNIVENEFDTRFEEIFQLTAKGMPEIYKQIGKSALSFVLSSEISSNRSFEATGFHNSRFQTNAVQSAELSTMDVNTQVLSALSLVEFSPNSVIKILETWFSLINIHGNMPTLVENILDYKVSPVLSLFHLLNTYSEKHGIDQLQPWNENIEKIGLKLLEKASSQVSFLNLFESPSSQTVSVEQHCLTVVASRVLKKLSATIGKSENVKKFSDFNAKLDNFDVLTKQFLDPNTNSFRDVTHVMKDGKKVPSFSQRSSLSPLLYGLIPSDSELLKSIFQDIENPETLWSSYGVRSGRGKDVSLPFNFHILKSLHYYSQQSSPNQDAAYQLYVKMRNNIILYVAREFKKTNTFWEAYSCENGEGQGQKDYLPSVIVLKVLAELY